MQKSQKEAVVQELTDRLQSSDTLIVADYRGLTMTEIDDLRGTLLEAGARFSVVKNTLTRRAAEAAGHEQLLTLLEGPTAIAFLESEGDPVAVAKALSEAARTTRILAIKGGVMQGRAITPDDVESLAKLPPIETLRGQVVGAVTAPLYTIVGLFTAPMRDLVGLIDARIEQLREQGDTGVAEPPTEAEAAPAAAPAAEAEAESEQPEAPASDPTESAEDAVEDTGTTETQEDES